MFVILLIIFIISILLNYFYKYGYVINKFRQHGKANIILSNLCCIKNDDNEDDDMKIFVSNHDNKNDNNRASVIETKIDRERKNGNLRKAQLIGIKLGTEVLNFSDYSFEDDENIKLHKKMLYAFIVKRAIQKNIKDKLLYDTANSCFLSTLMDTDEEFYDNLQISGSFSRYQLIDRDKRTNENDFGKAFAKLLGHKDEDLWIKKGVEFFKKWDNHTNNMILSIHFN